MMAVGNSSLLGFRFPPKAPSSRWPSMRRECALGLLKSIYIILVEFTCRRHRALRKTSSHDRWEGLQQQTDRSPGYATRHSKSHPKHVPKNPVRPGLITKTFN